MPSKALLRPADVLGEARRIPGVADGGQRRARSTGGARPPRRGDPRPRRLRSAALAGRTGDRPLPRRRQASPASGGSRSTTGCSAPRRAVVVATGSGAAMPPIDGLDSRPALEQPPGDHGQAGAREHDRARRRPGRQRALAGLVLAGDPGDAGRGRRAPALPRGALRRGGSRRVAARALRRRRPHRRRRPSGSRPAAPARSSTSSDGSRVEGAELLLAVGRVPRHRASSTSASAGVEADEHGFLDTDDRLRVGGRDWLYAIGDVNGRALFTHIGKYQAWVAAENLLGRPVEASAESARLAARHLHRPAGGGGRQDPRTRPARPGSTPARSTFPPTAPPAPASRARTPAAPRGSSSTRAARRSSAPPSPASRPPTSSRPPPSRSSARSRCSACATRSPPIPAAARSG